MAKIRTIHRPKPIDAKVACIAAQELASFARSGCQPQLREYVKHLESLVASHVPQNLSWVWQENQELKQRIKELEDAQSNA